MYLFKIIRLSIPDRSDQSGLLHRFRKSSDLNARIFIIVLYYARLLGNFVRNESGILKLGASRFFEQ